jgi:transposase-like protein
MTSRGQQHSIRVEIQLPYSPEFRAEAVRLAHQAERPISDLAAELSVHPSTLRRWIHAATDPGRSERTARLTRHGHVGSNGATIHNARNLSNAPGVGTLLMESPIRLAESTATTEAEPDGDRVRPGARIAHRTASVAVVGILALSVLLSGLITPSSSIYRAGVVLHVLSLVVGFGAVVLVDWHGLLWIAGRRTLHESRRLAETAGPLIWAAIVGLLASATMLEPDLGSPLTWIKIGAVLLIVLNGVAVNSLSQALSAQPPGQMLRDLSAQLRRRLMASAVSSQAGWWIAITIGLITDMHRD